MRWALLVSLAVHGALVWLLLGGWPPRPAALPDAVEVSLEPEPAAGEPSARAPAAGNARPARTAVTARAPARSDAIARGAATGGDAGEAATPAPNPEGRLVEHPAPGASLAGESDRLSTFRPAHPDLLGGVRSPDGKRRDLLASPLAKGEAGPRELPKVVRGSGGVTARIGDDGSIHFGGPKDIALGDPELAKVGEGAGVGLSGRFDVTDQIMKLAGQDPYASAKRALADETREQRLCMARRFQGERQKQELWNLAGKVRRLAARADLSPADRRALIFDIWDECLEEAEAGPSYGAMARATILSVIREVFPAGTERAYPPAELLALNHRRTSRQRFAPYDPIAAAEARHGRHPDAGPPGECPMP